MHTRLRLGIRQKVVLVLALTLFSGLTASTYFTLREQSEAILEEIERRGRETSHFVAQTLAYRVIAYDYHTIELLLKELTTHEDIVYARVLSPQGNLMGEIGAGQQHDPDVKLFQVPVRLHGEQIGELTLGLSTARIRATLERQKHNSRLRQGLVILVVLLGELAALSYIIIRPLTVMARAMRFAEANGDGRPRLPLLGHDEFGEIAVQFNALHERLDEARLRLEARVQAADRELQQAYEQLARQAEALRRKNADLEQLAITDALTGLYNKRYFEQLMESEIRSAVREARILSIVLLDIAHFKQLNERYGLQSGDRVIAEVAQRLARRTRRSDVLCRFGGDEFFLLLRGATAAEALRLADELHKAVCATPIALDGATVEIGLSIGIATYPCTPPVESAEALFAYADEALRASKRRGRNRVIHHAQLDHEVPLS